MKNEAAMRGLAVDELDLFRSGFSPVLQPDDEPAWGDPDKVYSVQVRKLAASLQEVDTLVVVFPIWWYSLPAMLKGYIDRVWNYGLLYGNGKRLPVNSIRWIALVGGAKSHFEKRGDHKYLEHLLNDGIAAYCGVEDSTVTFLYNAIGFEEETDDLAAHHQALIGQARSTIAAAARANC